MGKQFGEEIIEKVLKLKEKGKSNREIGNIFNLTVKQMKNLLTRYRIKQENLLKGIALKPKGRPKTRDLTKQEKLELENKRLRTENDLLRSFLQAAGRM